MIRIIFILESKDDFSYDYESILLGSALEWIKENKLVWALGKVNLIIMYKNELSPEKKAITQEFTWSNTPKGPSIDNYDTS